MTRPPDRSGKAPGDKGFDAVWGEILGDGETPGADATEGEKQAAAGTKVWDEPARARGGAAAEREARESSEVDPSADAEEGSAGTRFGPADELARKAAVSAAEREMERIMEEAPPWLPTPTPAPSRTRAYGSPDPKPALRVVVSAGDTETSEPDGDEPDGGEPDGDEPDGDEPAKLEPAKKAPEARAPEKVERETQADTSDAAKKKPAAAKRERVEIAPVEPAEPVRTAGGGKMLIGLVGAAMVAGLGWALTRTPEPPRKPSTVTKPPPAAPIPPKGGPPGPSGSADGAKPSSAVHAGVGEHFALGAAEAAEATGSTGATETTDGAIEPEPDPPVAAAGSTELREPPPGTPEEIAADFRKLPVSAADRPPVGGVGAGGTHVDRIWMGTTYAHGDCIGKRDGFSVDSGDRPSVCVRVVHPREKEEIAVVWEKKGGAARRSKLTIKPIHAYRTRAYLVLRREYVGEWTVRILSADGVELASHDFEVVQ